MYSNSRVSILILRHSAFFLLSISIVVIRISAKSSRDIVWTHHLAFGNGDFQLKWTIDLPAKWITLEMSAPTKGYLGIGFSPHGGMAGSDIVIGWVDAEGQPHLKNYYGVGNQAPVEDSEKNYELIYASETLTSTKIVFRRKLDTCDVEHDLTISDKPIRVIWAWHPSDPKRNSQLHWHGAGAQRGVRLINFKNPKRVQKFPDDYGNLFNLNGNGTISWDATMYNVRVPKTNAYYYCRILKFPRLDEKHHIIGYRPSVSSPDHKPYVRHISLHSCKVPRQYGRTQDYFERHLYNLGQGCFDPRTPTDWIQFCVTSVVAVSIGAEGAMLPDNVGIPIGPDSQEEPLYFRLEIQYENAEGANFLDSSGLKIYYTPQLRRFDSSTLPIGHRRTPFLTVPPLQQSFKISGHCSAECTRRGLSTAAAHAKVFSILLHSHSAGKKITLRHIRDGIELPLLAQENHYDFQYEEFVILPNQVSLLPGDDLLLECTFETSARTSFTFGGSSFQNEMCEAVILYYPNSNLADCRSQPEFYSYFEPLNVQNVSGHLLQRLGLPYSAQDFLHFDDDDPPAPDDSDIIYLQNRDSHLEDVFDTLQITKPDRLLGLNLVKYLNSLDWTNSTLSKQLQDQWGHGGSHYMFCATPAGRRIRLKDNVVQIPHFKKAPNRPELSVLCQSQKYPQSMSNSPDFSFTFRMLTYFIFILLLHY